MIKTTCQQMEAHTDHKTALNKLRTHMSLDQVDMFADLYILILKHRYFVIIDTMIELEIV